MGSDYARAGVEPALEEMLRDPIVRLVMRRDGLEPADVRSAIDAARGRLFLLRGRADQPARRSP